MLESDFDEVLGQDATQTQVFEAGQGLTAAIASFQLCLPDPAWLSGLFQLTSG